MNKQLRLCRVTRIYALCTAFFLFVFSCLAGEGEITDSQGFRYDEGAAFSLIEENDLIVNTDRHYTQGIKLSFLHRDGWLPGWLAKISHLIPTWGFEEKTERMGYEIGQSIFTPAETELSIPQPNDRPYAGWLYTGLMIQRRGLTRDRFLTLESIQLDLGVIGKASLAEEAQTWVHDLRGFDHPRGWKHQLHTEPGLAIRYQRAWLVPLAGERGDLVDLLPRFGLSLGNVETSIRAGISLRAGLNVPRDFGVQTINSLITTGGGRSQSQTSKLWGFYVYTSAEGWAVLHNAFLDGNLFESSPHVTRNIWVREWASGFVLVSPTFEAGFSFVIRSEEFTEQRVENSYGSVVFKIKFSPGKNPGSA
jgi:hypothetical protein